ncbi:MAG: nucleoside-diphosphate sugar epimerase/dehydratase [Bacteroidales bacterium]|nr:nucleoside-diphosphate sugar epimerase/dehydratase [Bacteroidales bacterium]MDY3102135.1 nucleoside-diphosphate sugar epimerase/dehydratase [Porphyromonas sp.]
MNTNFKRRVKQLLQNRVFKDFIDHRYILLFDTLLGGVSALLVGWGISWLISVPFLSNKQFLIAIGVAIVSTFITAYLFRTYKQVFRFSTLDISTRTFLYIVCNTLSISFLSTTIFMVSDIELNFKILLLYSLSFFITFFIAVVTSRFCFIVLARWVTEDTTTNVVTPVVIYDAKEASVSLAHLLEMNRHYNVAGFCSRNDHKSSFTIANKPIFQIHSRKDLSVLIKRYRIRAIIFANKDDLFKERTKLVEDCIALGISPMIAPPIEKTTPAILAEQGVRNIKIEDLLLRDEIHLDPKPVEALYAEKTILVTGAAGSIGSEIARQVAQLNVKHLILFDNAETPLHNIRLELQTRYKDLIFTPIIGDVRSKERVNMVFERYHPQIVLHAAAYKHVPLMEENPCEAILVNCIGTQNIADHCLKYGVEKMVMISTDKAVNPTNVMGATKRSAEMYVQSLGHAIEEGKINGKTIFLTTRFGNVLGSQGSVFHLFREQIAKGGPITVTHPEITRFFMSISEACRLVLQASTLGDSTKIFVFEMGESHKIVELARQMIRLSGLEPDKQIKITFTGLRPGEKIYEEVLDDHELTEPTNLPKIKIARVRPLDFTPIAEIFEQMRTLAKAVDIDKSVALIKKLVPEYKSNNSEFEKLDKDKNKR